MKRAATSSLMTARAGKLVDILGAEGGAPAGLVAPFTISGITGFGSEPSGAAVDNSATSPAKGTLYVTDVRGHKLRKFTRNAGTEKYEAAGEFVTSAGASLGEVLGVEVDTKGNVYVADWSSGSAIKFSPTGTQLARISTEPALGRPSDVAIDSAGDLFVQAYSGGKVVKYPVNGSGEIEPTVFSTVVPSGATGLAVDTTTNTLFVALGSHVSEYDATTLVKSSDFGALGSTARVAVNAATERIYVADSSTAKVAVFGPLQTFGDGSGAAAAVANVSFHSADLSATIDDNNALPTNWRLEVSSNDFATTETVASGRTGGGESNVAVSGTATGLSLDTDYKFRVVTNKGSGPATDVSSNSIPFKTLSAPNATATPLVTENMTEESATVSAAITDNSAAPTNWRIEFSTDGGSTWNPVSSGSTGGGESNVAVSGTESSLQPNTDYQFRLVINKGEGSSDVVASVVSFKTVAPPPVIVAIGAVKVSDTSARLVGSIDPRNADTSYVFEYGSTPSLDSSTAPLDIGAGTTPITVSQPIVGLSPDTTYYFQIAATNATGTTTSPTHTLHTRTTPLPQPAQRGWEMVSPPDKNYGDVDKVATYSPDVVGASPDGNSVGFCTTALFGDPPGRMTQFCAPYISRRTSSGWKTADPFPEYCRTDPVTGIGGGRLSVSVSRDFSHFVDKASESKDARASRSIRMRPWTKKTAKGSPRISMSRTLKPTPSNTTC